MEGKSGATLIPNELICIQQGEDFHFRILYSWLYMYQDWSNGKRGLLYLNYHFVGDWMGGGVYYCWSYSCDRDYDG